MMESGLEGEGVVERRVGWLQVWGEVVGACLRKYTARCEISSRECGSRVCGKRERERNKMIDGWREEEERRSRRWIKSRWGRKGREGMAKRGRRKKKEREEGEREKKRGREMK